MLTALLVLYRVESWALESLKVCFKKSNAVLQRVQRCALESLKLCSRESNAVLIASLKLYFRESKAPVQ